MLQTFHKERTQTKKKNKKHQQDKALHQYLPNPSLLRIGGWEGNLNKWRQAKKGPYSTPAVIVHKRTSASQRMNKKHLNAFIALSCRPSTKQEHNSNKGNCKNCKSMSQNQHAKPKVRSPQFVHLNLTACSQVSLKPWPRPISSKGLRCLHIGVFVTADWGHPNDSLTRHLIE